MKKAFLFLAVNSLSVIFIFAQEAPSFKEAKMNLAYQQYIQLKDALVASKADDAKRMGGQLQQTLLSMNNKKGSNQAGKIAASSKLDDQRLAFSELSDEMNNLVKANKPVSGTLYLEYCPMANNDAGAYWLSNEKEIKNPYFGSMMLKCGSVKETIH
ncbi:MAG TPA: hypothetical protein DGG95_11280 [Cytophagales bacterium]|jgi:hypothetical protein|nr:hypothetical protein [Cytophagales bacterium]